MTGFDGKGHPLSAKRVGLIKAAIDADRLQKAYPCKISLHTLAGTGLTLEDFNEALGQLAARHHLSEDEKQVVGKMTLAYLASRAEENDPGFPMPDAAALKRQIADGACNGTFYGLERLRKIPLAKTETGIATTGDRIQQEDNELAFMLNSEDVEVFAYFAGKFLPVGDSLISCPYNGPGAFVMKDLVEHKDELLAFRRQHGKMTFGDLWRLRLGETMPEVPRYHQQRGFQLALYKKWMTDFDRLHGVEEEENDENSNPPPAQLKTLVLLSGQAGNTSLTLAGVQGNDHYPTDKTFTKLDNEQVRFTVAATVGNRRVSVTYDIAQDGTSTCRGMMAQNVEPPPQA